MKQLYRKESVGSRGTEILEINVDATKLPDLEHETIRNAVWHAAELIEQALTERIIAEDPESQKFAEQNRLDLLGLFTDPIFVETIPNGYCSRACCKHLPWFIVTTKVGRIKIGWRKRVINIDWSETVGTKTSDELFAAEDVTKGTRLIHAWSLDKAREYITRILGVGA